MSLSSTINKNPVIAIGLFAVCIFILLYRLFFGGSSGKYTEMYFYDTNTGELFTAAAGTLPPTKAPSDSGDSTSGVWAFVYSCGDCDDEDSQFIGYLQRFTPKGKELIMDGAMSVEHEMEVRTPDGSEWFKMNSPTASKIMASVSDRCQEGTPKMCLPNR